MIKLTCASLRRALAHNVTLWSTLTWGHRALLTKNCAHSRMFPGLRARSVETPGRHRDLRIPPSAGDTGVIAALPYMYMPHGRRTRDQRTRWPVGGVSSIGAAIGAIAAGRRRTATGDGTTFSPSCSSSARSGARSRRTFALYLFRFRARPGGRRRVDDRAGPLVRVAPTRMRGAWWRSTSS